MGRQYSDMTIEELIDHALKYSSRISETDAVIELSQRVLSAQRALDAEREKAKQLGRTLADVYQQRDGLQAQLRQVEGERDAAQALVSERASMIGSLTAALRRAKAEVWREAATHVLTCMHAVDAANDFDARAAQIEEGEWLYEQRRL